MKSASTLIQYIYDSHFKGVEQVVEMKEKWCKLADRIDEDIFNNVLQRFEIQLEDAKEWRDVINSYFYRKSGITDELNRKIY